eukprot:scaffold718_cov342-Pavlova_lutheri.AAC.48
MDRNRRESRRASRRMDRNRRESRRASRRMDRNRRESRREEGWREGWIEIEGMDRRMDRRERRRERRRESRRERRRERRRESRNVRRREPTYTSTWSRRSKVDADDGQGDGERLQSAANAPSDRTGRICDPAMDPVATCQSDDVRLRVASGRSAARTGISRYLAVPCARLPEIRRDERYAVLRSAQVRHPHRRSSHRIAAPVLRTCTAQRCRCSRPGHMLQLDLPLSRQSASRTCGGIGHERRRTAKKQGAHRVRRERPQPRAQAALPGRVLRCSHLCSQRGLPHPTLGSVPRNQPGAQTRRNRHHELLQPLLSHQSHFGVDLHGRHGPRLDCRKLLPLRRGIRTAAGRRHHAADHAVADDGSDVCCVRE